VEEASSNKPKSGGTYKAFVAWFSCLQSCSTNPEDYVQPLRAREVAPLELSSTYHEDSSLSGAGFTSATANKVTHVSPSQSLIPTERKISWAEIVESKIKAASDLVLSGHAKKAFMASTTKQTSEHWYADSGCTQHMTDQHSWFTTSSQFH
jgi:hypothetical protein